MAASWRVLCQTLCLGSVLALSACSSIMPSVGSSQSQSLDLVACLKVDVGGPATVAEGEGFTAQVTTSNICNGEIQVPIADATAISKGKDTGVEISFHVLLTDPEITTATASQGYLLRWESVQSHPSYVLTQTMLTLAPGEKLVREVSWDGLTDGGKTLLSGNYVLFGEFYYTPKGIKAKDFNVISSEAQPLKVVAK